MMIAERLGPEARDGEVRVQFKADARGFARFFQTADASQRLSEPKTGRGRIRIEFDRSGKPPTASPSRPE
jgi:hypothetical protein